MTRRVLRRLVGAVALGMLFAVAVVVPTPAFACSCAFAANDQRNFDGAAVVFAGDLVSDDGSLFGRTRTLTYRVQRVYKGSAFARQTVVTEESSASCGLERGAAGPYLVFAQGDGADELWAALCGGTRAGGAPAAFGPGVAPAAGSNDRRAVWWIGSGALLVVAGLGMALARRRRERRQR